VTRETAQLYVATQRRAWRGVTTKRQAGVKLSWAAVMWAGRQAEQLMLKSPVKSAGKTGAGVTGVLQARNHHMTGDLAPWRNV